MVDKNWLRSFILSVVKPLKSGKFVAQASDNSAGLDNLIPDGGYSDSFRLTSPFGLIAGIPKGVSSFYQALLGSGYESIIIALLHAKRPQPAVGQTILYSTDSSGATVQVTISLNPDGTLVITAPTKVSVICPAIELGSGALEKVLNGETFQTFFNQHTHEGNLGVPTGPPINPSISAHLSATVKANK